MAKTQTNTSNDRTVKRILDVPRGDLPTIGHHLQLMRGSVDENLWALANRLHTTLRMSDLKREDDFASAWDCWWAAMKLQGTIQTYRDELKVEAEGLKARYQQWRSCEQAWPANRIHSVLDQFIEAIEPELSTERCEELRGILEAAFKGEPPKRRR
ncbi:MAG: hypothetical protein V1685_04485 [Parcubacteria group bacterium]